MKQYLLAAVFTFFATGASAQDADLFDYVCLVKKDVIEGVTSDGQKLSPYEDDFEIRISFDLGTYEYFEINEIDYLISADENQLVLSDDTEIRSNYDAKLHYKRIWKINRKTGKSIEDYIYYDSKEGKKITGTAHTESDCTLAPFTEF